MLTRKKLRVVRFLHRSTHEGVFQSYLTPEVHAGWYIRHEQSHQPMGKCRKHQLSAAALNLTPRRDSRRIARAREVDTREYNLTDGTDGFSRHHTRVREGLGGNSGRLADPAYYATLSNGKDYDYARNIQRDEARPEAATGGLAPQRSYGDVQAEVNQHLADELARRAASTDRPGRGDAGYNGTRWQYPGFKDLSPYAPVLKLVGCPWCNGLD